MSASTLTAAEGYLRRGWVPLPLPAQSKKPATDDWPSFRPAAADLPRYFSNGGNIGVLLGPASGGLVDIDIDCSEALALRSWLPRTGACFGRVGNPRSHYLYNVSDETGGTTQYEDLDGTMLIEYRSTGGQTVVPPSVHPSGEDVAWELESDPARLPATEVRTAVAEIAAAALLARHYPAQGSRHAFTLALAGVLLRAGWTAEHVERFVVGVAQAAHDEESHQRAANVRSTAERLAEDGKVSGWPKIITLLGDSGKPIAAKVQEWLGLPSRKLMVLPPPEPSRDAHGQPLPQIVVTDSQLNVLSEQALEALVAHATNLFVYGGQLGRVREHSGGGRVELLNADALIGVLARVADWFTLTHTREGSIQRPTFPHRQVAADLLSYPGCAARLPLLSGIVACPVIREDGTILSTPGYDAASTLYYVGPALSLDVPDVPSDAEVQRARALLDELVCNFPFASDADRAGLHAALQTVVLPPGAVRRPLFLLTKNQQGAGAGLLADVIALLATGRDMPVSALPDESEETRKVITTWVAEASPLGCFDNIIREVDDAPLAIYATCATWKDRLLGTNRALEQPPVTLVFLTGNNVTLRGDISRRVVPIRLDSPEERPWEIPAERFTHPDLRGYVRENRPALLGAVLTLARAWHVRGRPAGRASMGSYESWATRVGGVLQVAGIPDFLGNREHVYTRVDTDRSEWTGFLGALHTALDGGALVAREIAEHIGKERGAVLVTGEAKDADGQPVPPSPWREVLLALPGPLAELSQDAGKSSRSLGKTFSSREGKWYGGYRLQAAGSEKKAIRWQVDKRKPSGEEATESKASEPAAPEAPLPPSAPQMTTEGVFGEFSVFATSRTYAREIVTPHISPYIERGETNTLNSPNTPIDPNASYTLIADAAALTAAVAALTACPVLGCDTETTGLSPHTDRLRLLQLATPEQCYLLDTWAVAGWQRIVAPVFADPARVLVGHNIRFDLSFLQAEGIVPDAGVFDTMIGAQVLDAGAHLHERGRYTLAGVAERLLRIQLDKQEQRSDWGTDRLSAEQLAYAANDAAILLPLREALAEQLERTGQSGVAALEMGAVPAVAAMEYHGMPFDRAAWNALAETAAARKAALTTQIVEMLTTELGANGLFGRVINLGSPQQVGEALTLLGLTLPTVTNAEGVTSARVDDAALAGLRDQHPVIPLLLAYRDAAKAASTYGAKYAVEHVHPATGRIHSSYGLCGSAAGRMTCRTPNIQQVPHAASYRSCFRVPAGRALIKADYSQIELRIAATLANDTAMLTAYREGQDLHTLTASRVLGMPREQVTKEHRQLAKACNFGLLYGMGAAGLADYAGNNYGVHLSLEEASAHRDRFFATYAGLRRWHTFTGRVREPMPTRTMAGRLRADVGKFTEKLNSPVQGSGADGLKAALGRLWRHRHEAPTAQLVAVVHDEIVAECPAEDAGQVADWLTRHMIAGMAAIVTGVPIEVEATIARDWAGTPLETERHDG